jgi:hypothetical protein
MADTDILSGQEGIVCKVKTGFVIPTKEPGSTKAGSGKTFFFGFLIGNGLQGNVSLERTFR